MQPTIRQANDKVRYQEMAPCHPLQKFIYCYWQLQTPHQLHHHFNYSVVADGCIDIFFELDNPKNSFVMGFCTNYMEFPLPKTFNYVGIRFLPTMFPQLFRIDASELSDRSEHLDSIAPETAHFIADSCNTSMTFNTIKELLDAYFVRLVSNSTFKSDSRLYGALKIILENSGVINVNEDLDTGISQRQLQRLFKRYVGTTAKTFSKVVKFQHVLGSTIARQNSRSYKSFYDLGYYDQAHFIKDFKKCYGTTPVKAFDK